MPPKRFRFGLPVFIALLLLTVLLAPGNAHAQWPPFWFDLIPSHEDGKVTYAIGFYTDVDWMMADLTFKIPVPPGTRFVRTVADPGIEVDFDGEEVTVFATIIDGNIPEVHLEFEVIDETATVITAHTWISWKGDHPGDYLTDDVSIDLTRKTLNWEIPFSSLSLGARAIVDGDVITYSLYPKNDSESWMRMWDLKITLPIPKGTTFVSAEAPSPFVTSFDGQQISFFALEMARGLESGPLRVEVSTEGITDDFVVTRAQATWKNEGWLVGEEYPVEGQMTTGYIVVRPRIPQIVVADAADDVPFSDYDLTSVALQSDEDALRVIFYTLGDVDAAKDPVEFSFWIDSDCSADTGMPLTADRGVEYWVGYEYGDDEAGMYSIADWTLVAPIQVSAPAGGNTVSMWVPYDALPADTPFCWVAETWSGTEDYYWNDGGYHSQELPTDQVANSDDIRLTTAQWRAMATGTSYAKLPPALVTPTVTATMPVTLLPTTGTVTRGPSSWLSLGLGLGLVVLLLVFWWEVAAPLCGGRRR